MPDAEKRWFALTEDEVAEIFVHADTYLDWGAGLKLEDKWSDMFPWYLWLAIGLGAGIANR